MSVLINSDSPKPITYTSTFTPDGHREYQATWQILSDDVNDGPVTILAATGLPQVYPPFGPSIFQFGNDLDLGASVKSAAIRPVRADDPSITKHIAVFSYSTRSEEGEDPQERDAIDNPLNRPVKWSGSFAQFTKVYDQTINGFPLMNTAGDPFVDPPIEGDHSRPTIVAIKNLGSLNLSLWRDYADAVNSDTFLGLPPGTAKVSNITWDQQFHTFGSAGNILRYFQVRYEFHLADTWAKEILDAGFREVDLFQVPLPEPSRIKGGDELDVQQPWPLFAGRALTSQEIDAGNLFSYLTFKIYKELPFSALGLPSTIT